MLYFKLSSNLMLDIITNSAPQNICNLFNSTKDIHQYNTRSASIILGSIILKTLFRRLPKHIFKKKIQALLFVALETLDSYADASTLISEIKKAS